MISHDRAGKNEAGIPGNENSRHSLVLICTPLSAFVLIYTHMSIYIRLCPPLFFMKTRSLSQEATCFCLLPHKNHCPAISTTSIKMIEIPNFPASPWLQGALKDVVVRRIGRIVMTSRVKAKRRGVGGVRVGGLGGEGEEEEGEVGVAWWMVIGTTTLQLVPHCSGNQFCSSL